MGLPTSKLLPEAGRPETSAGLVGKTRLGSLFGLAIGWEGRERLGHAAGIELRVVQDANLGESSSLHDAADKESKCLFNVDLETGTRLHEAAASFAGPIKAHGGGHLTALLQIALVARYDFDRRNCSGCGAVDLTWLEACFECAFCVVTASFRLHVNEVVKVLQSLERITRRYIIDHEKGICPEVGRRPHAAVLLLASRVCQGEMIRRAIDATSDAVRVLDGGIILGRPLRTDQSESNG